MQNELFRGYMQDALAAAREAGRRGETPVGAAVSSPDGKLISVTGNRVRELRDPTAHAEVLALREACQAVGSERLAGYNLFVTLEPCPMCASAISQARIARLYFGANDPKSGGVEHGAKVFIHPQCHHSPEVYGGIEELASSRLLTEFFSKLRLRGSSENQSCS